MNDCLYSQWDGDIREHFADGVLEGPVAARADVELGAHHAGDGSGGEHLKVNALGVLVHECEKLNAQESDFFIYAFNVACFVKLNLLGFIKSPAVEPVLPGILVATGGTFLFLFYNESL